jgi:hypothetical protein
MCRFRKPCVPPSSDDPTERYKSGSENLACFLALSSRKWPELAKLVTTWPDLPEPLRAGITAVVRSSTKRASLTFSPIPQPRF